MGISLVPDICYPHQVDDIDMGINPNDPSYSWHLLAEGDSWFDIGGLPPSNLLYETRFSKWTQILSLARFGDTIKNMSSIVGNTNLVRFLAKKGFNYKWDGILISGGGNDMIDWVKKIIINPASDSAKNDYMSFIDHDLLIKLIADIQDGYRNICALRDDLDSRSQGCPVFTHTYDYATPRKAPALFFGFGFGGPWLYPALQDIEANLAQKIADHLMDALADGLLALDCKIGLDGKKLPNFYVIDTRNTLIRANATESGNSNDWLNEIHPNHGGYRKLAAIMSERINTVLS